MSDIPQPLGLQHFVPHAPRSAAMHWLFCGHSRWDYLVPAAIGVLPMLTALWAGVAWTRSFGPHEYRGYLQSGNWLHWPLTLPCILWIVRRLTRPIFSKSEDKEPPPIVGLFPEVQQAAAAAALARETTASMNLAIAALLTLFISLADMREVAGFFLRSWRGGNTGVPRELDWSVFVVGDATLFWPNLLHNLVAYATQATAVLMALAMIVAFFRHNRFLLLSVYQRRIHRHSRETIAIDIDDEDHRFGLGGAHKAFDVQVLTLIVAGPIFLVTRYANVSSERQAQLAELVWALVELITFRPDKLQRLLPELPVIEMLGDVGQWMAVCGWLATLGVVSMPLFVKFLPRVRKPRVQRGLVRFLEEFLPDDRLPWPPRTEPAAPVLKTTAEQFAQNAFWPDGDELAWWLFFGSFFVLGWILLPVPIEGFQSLLPFVALGAVAALATRLLFNALGWSLAIVHPWLVRSRK